MKNYNPNKNLSCLTHLDEKNLYGCKMCQKLPVDEFKWIGNTNFTDHLITYYNDIGSVGYTLEVDIKYPEQLGMVHKELLFLPKKNEN